MVTDALKKFREIFAYGLLAVAALYLISGLSLLMKSQSDVGLDFSGKAAAFGYLFAHPVLIFCVVAAVALVVGFGEVTKNARIVVLAALAIAGVALLLALISLFASFGANEARYGAGIFGGVLGAGKIVGLLLGLAQLLLLGLAAWFAFTAFRALPRTASAAQAASSWGQGQGYAGSQGYGQPWGQQDAGYAQQGWGQPAQSGWQAGPVAGATAVGASATGWGDQYQSQPEHQGQPAAAWGNPESTYAGTTEGQPAWGAPAQPQQQWGAQQPTVGGQQWAQPESGQPVERQGATAADAETSRWEPPAGEQGERPARTEGEQQSGEQSQQQPPGQQQSWWQGPAQ